MWNNHCHRVTTQLQLINTIIINYIYMCVFVCVCVFVRAHLSLVQSNIYIQTGIINDVSRPLINHIHLRHPLCVEINTKYVCVHTVISLRPSAFRNSHVCFVCVIVTTGLKIEFFSVAFSVCSTQFAHSPVKLYQINDIYILGYRLSFCRMHETLVTCRWETLYRHNLLRIKK